MSRDAKIPYYIVFFVAGIPALIYQVAWQRVLALYFGVDIYSTSVTVSAFMLGLGVGSLLGGLIADRLARPDRAYAVCEALLALCGVASLPMFRLVGNALAGAALLPTALAVSALLLLPTLLMGMTLPLMVRTLVASDDSNVGKEVAWLYGVNTLGAAVGSLLTAYFVIGSLGLSNATVLAAALNLSLAIGIWLLRRQAPERVPVGIPSEPVVARAVAAPVATTNSISQQKVLTLAFISGWVALGYEIVWYRLLKLLLHGTTYVFGTILGVLLLGMGLGSLLARRRIEEPGPARRFGNAQLVMAAYTCVSLALLGRGGNWPGLKHLIAASSFISFHPAPELAMGDWSLISIYSLLDTFFWPVLIVGIPSVAMGYGFPNLIRAAPRVSTGVGKSLGVLYCANIAGATLGSLTVGFVLLEYLGSERTLLVLVGLGASCSFLAGSFGGQSHRRLMLAAGAAALGLVIFPGHGGLIRSLHLANSPSVEYVGREDKTGIVVLRRQLEVIAFSEERALLGEERLYIDGASHGGMTDSASGAFDKELKVALAAHPAPRRVLSIGLGDGRMVASALSAPTVDEVVVVELSAGLREVLATTTQGKLIDSSPKLRFVNDDGRRWLLANPGERFDVVMSWPLHAAHAFSGSLYSEEFFELVRSHLAPPGIFFTRTADAFATARTLASAFPFVVRVKGTAYVASLAPLRFSAARAEQASADLLASLGADQAAILLGTKDAPLVRDFWPQTEYYLTYPWAWVLQTRGAPRELLYASPREDLVPLVGP